MSTKKVEENTVEMVTLVVPREPGGADMLFVALNGKAYNIPRGKVVTIPKVVADVYYESVAAQEAAYMRSEEFQAEMKVVQGAP